MKSLVNCQGIVCRLGKQLVLDRANFEVAEGETVALIGSSGCGKSTLLRLIAGLEIAEQGEISIAGETASRNGRTVVAPHRRGIAMLFQDLALWPNLTVWANVELGLAGLRLPRNETKVRIEHSLKLCEIQELARRKPGTLSGGQQQRVAIARALAMQPRLLLLDEPLGGLDLITKQALLLQIARLQSELQFAIVLVTHDPVEVQGLCRSLAVMENGQIVEHGSFEEIKANPKSELGKTFASLLTS